MSGERPTLAEAMCPRHSSPCAACRSAEPGARQWFLALLADKTLVERCAQADCSSWGTGGTWELIGSTLRNEHRAAARAVLTVIAEAVREG